MRITGSVVDSCHKIALNSSNYHCTNRVLAAYESDVERDVLLFVTVYDGETVFFYKRRMNAGCSIVGTEEVALKDLSTCENGYRHNCTSLLQRCYWDKKREKKNVSSIQGSNIESVPAVSTINLIVVLKIFIVWLPPGTRAKMLEHQLCLNATKNATKMQLNTLIEKKHSINTTLIRLKCCSNNTRNSYLKPPTEDRR